jgi:hypothetical protein
MNDYQMSNQLLLCRLECGVKRVGQEKFGRILTQNFHINVQIHITIFVHSFVHSCQTLRTSQSCFIFRHNQHSDAEKTVNEWRLRRGNYDLGPCTFNKGPDNAG